MADAKTDDSEKVAVDAGVGIAAATEEERQLAQQARTEFDRGQWDTCLSTLNQLGTKRGQDLKVSHNRVVAEFCKSGFTRIDDFKATLASITAKASQDSLDDLDQCVLYYNQAVVLYHMRHYYKALSVIDKLFQFIEPMDENLARRALFLLVELYLCTYQPDKAMGMLAFFEKTFSSNGGKADKEKEKEGEKESKEASQDSPEGLRAKMSQYKTQCYLMMRSLKSCKRELKTLSTSGASTSCQAYLKANFDYLRGNYQKAMKTLSGAGLAAVTPSSSGESVAVMFYNNQGVLHFNLGKHHLGLFYFRKALQENTHVTQELQKADAGKSLSGHPLPTLGLSCHYELLYNIGIQQLHCQRPVAAFDCLVEVVQVYRNNPRLWLRIAECCIMAHKPSNDYDRQLDQQLQVVQGARGTGVHRKLILGSGLRHDRLTTGNAAMPVLSLEFAAICLRNALMLLPEDPLAAPTASSGPAKPARDASELLDGRLTNAFGLVQAAPGNPMKHVEVANLRCSILASSAYVSLCLSDCVLAVDYAERLLKQPRLSGAHRYLGRLYLAEALVMLDRLADAIRHLDIDTVTDMSTAFPEHKVLEQEKAEKNGEREPQEPPENKCVLYTWAPHDVPRARAIMQYNLATAHAIRGEYEKALMHLGQSIHNIGMPLPAQMYFLKLYLELMEGRRKTAQTIIKEHFGHIATNRI